MTTVIFGASGFVGTALAQRMAARGDRFVAVIRTPGNAWRLASLGIPVRSVDILDPREVSGAVRGADAVVNCTRGGDLAMLKGLRNLLDASAAAGVRRFVHLSSVAVYGDPPPPESARELAPARPVPGSYGALKLRQDELVARAHVRGLSAAVLCPPNIGGLYSTFYANVVDGLRRRDLPAVAGGTLPLNVLDVENLCHAIELALGAETTDGARIFITDGESATWGRLFELLSPLAGAGRPLSIDAADVPKRRTSVGSRPSIVRSLKHLVSSDVRKALRTDPLWDRIHRAARGLVPKALEPRLRRLIEGPRRVPVRDINPALSPYVGQQMRNVVHRIDRARAVLGYEPEVSFEASVARFAAWYRRTRGMELETWPLASVLYE